MIPTSPAGDGLTVSDLWEIGVHVVPILIAVIIATIKITRVLREEIRGEIGPIMKRIDQVEESFLRTVRDLWDHNNSQDVRIEAVTAAHNRLRGAHDAITASGGHSPHHVRSALGEYGGPERRQEARPPKHG
jgi:hypothetical protein